MIDPFFDCVSVIPYNEGKINEVDIGIKKRNKLMMKKVRWKHTDNIIIALSHSLRGVLHNMAWMEVTWFMEIFHK